MSSAASVRRFRLATVVAAVVALLAAGCGGSSSEQSGAGAGKVDFTLNYLPGGAQAGFMYGKKLGIFDKHGINLNIIPGSGSLTTAQLVAQGKADLAYVDAGTAFSVAAKGGDIAVVAPILQVNGYAIIALKSSGIDSVQKLAGKRLSVVPGIAPTVLLPAVLASGGLTIEQVEQQNMAAASQLGALLQHKADAIVAAGDVQGPQLIEQGAQVNQLFYYQNGVPAVGESIVANTDFMQKNPDLIRRFVDASLQSWVETKKNPSAAAQAEAEQFPAEGSAGKELDQIKVDIGLLCAAPGATTMGQVPDPVWQRTVAILKEFKLVPSDFDHTKFETTKFLPSSPPSCP